MATVHLDVHGVRVDIKSVDTGFSEYVERNYRPFAAAEGVAELRVEFEFADGWRVTGGEFELDDFRRLGTVPLFGESGLMKSFRAGYWHVARSRDSVLDVRIVMRRPGGLSRLPWSLIMFNRRRRLEGYRFLSRYVVNPPLMWMLRHRFDIVRTHAAAVERNGRAILIAGPTGSGKSTLALYLWKEKGCKLLADNSCLLDSESVYCFPENSRIFPGTLKLLGIPVPRSATPIEGRYHYELNDSDVGHRARPSSMVFLEARQQAGLKPLDTAEAIERLVILHLFLEWENYLTLGPLFPSFTPTAARSTITNLLAGVPCYTLSVPRSQPLAKTAKALVELL